jgi:hypothetical protein
VTILLDCGHLADQPPRAERTSLPARVGVQPARASPTNRRRARVEEIFMSNTLNETTKTAVNGAGSVQEGTRHTLASTLATLVKGVNAVSGIVALLHRLDRNDGLAWFGLARRRPLRSGGVFGVGVAVGAGLGLLFAPMTGAEMRTALLDRFGGPGDAPARATNGASVENHAPAKNSA